MTPREWSKESGIPMSQTPNPQDEREQSLCPTCDTHLSVDLMDELSRRRDPEASVQCPTPGFVRGYCIRFVNQVACIAWSGNNVRASPHQASKWRRALMSGNVFQDITIEALKPAIFHLTRERLTLLRLVVPDG